MASIFGSRGSYALGNAVKALEVVAVIAPVVLSSIDICLFFCAKSVFVLDDIRVSSWETFKHNRRSDRYIS